MENVIDTSTGLAGVLERLNRQSQIRLLEQIVQEINEHDLAATAKRDEELTKLREELKTQIDALTKASEEQAARVDTLTKTSEERAAQVAALSQRVEQQVTGAEEAKKNLAALQQQLSVQQASFDAKVGDMVKSTLDAKVGDMVKSTLDAKVGEMVKSALAVTQAEIAAQVSSSLEAKVSSLAQSVASLSAQGGGQPIIDDCTIDNGSFEAGPEPVDMFVRLRPGDRRIKGWTIRNGTVDYIDERYWRGADKGCRSVDLNTDETPAGSIEQVLRTVPGATYVVRFACAGNPAGPPAMKTLRVTADGQHAVHYGIDTTGKSVSDMGWVDRLYAFTATSSTTVLAFESTTKGAYGPAIDNVRIERAR